MAETAEVKSKACIRSVKHNGIPKETFAKCVPEENRESLLDVLTYFESRRYLGLESKELLEWSASNARGRPSTCEDHLRQAPGHEMKEEGSEWT